MEKKNDSFKEKDNVQEKGTKGIFRTWMDTDMDFRTFILGFVYGAVFGLILSVVLTIFKIISII